jgi:YVTN family beta-propeller protein
VLNVLTITARSVRFCALILSALACVGHAAPFAYITNSLDNNVSVIDTALNTLVTTVTVGTDPNGVAVNPTGAFAYVANRGSNNVSVINIATNIVVATVPVGGGPLGVAVNPAGTRVYVANNGRNMDGSASNTISVIDTSTNTVVDTVTVGYFPAGIAVNPAGTRVYVVINNEYSVAVIDTATNTVVATVFVGQAPIGIAINPAGTRAYVANSGANLTVGNSVSVIDTATNTVIGDLAVGPFRATVAVGDGPSGIAVNPAGTRVYVTGNPVSVIDTATNTVVDTVGIASYLGVAVNPAGTRAYLQHYGFDAVSVIDTATNAIVDSVPVGRSPTAFGAFIGGLFGAPGAPIIVSATPGSGQATITFTPPVSNGGSPITGYTATCNPGAFSTSGPASPLVVTGLTNGTTYACSVSATNANGAGPPSDTLNVTPPGVLTSSSAVSRKVHGSAGTFDLPLSLLDVHNPTTEPRQGPSHTIVFTFDRAIASATATVTEGLATAGTPTFAGNNVVVPLTGAIDAQYVTIALTNVVASDASTGGSGSVRVGFLAGDVNQNRVVTLADLGLVNAQLAQSVTPSNFLKDVNASGTLSLADKGITNARLTKSLPAP